jgi:uncharacterized protein (TIGR03435 family)
MARCGAVTFLLLIVHAGFAQDASLPSEFVVQIVKPSQSNAIRTGQVADGGEVSFRNITVAELLTAAYHKWESEMVGLPSWARSEQFDIVAKGPAQMTEADVSVRLKSLLIKEFRLAAHEDKEARDAFAMVAAGGGVPTLQSAPGPGLPGCKRGGSIEQPVLDCESITMDNLIGPLTFAAKDYLDRPVINLTGLSGTFHVRLEWVPQRFVDANGGLTLFAAFTQQLGLRLEKRKVPVPVLVIDHIERPPTAN